MIFNTSDPINVVLILAATVLLVYLGKETKKSRIPLITLIVFLALILTHALQFVTMAGSAAPEIVRVLSTSIAVDFGLVMIAFLGYLWVDDIEAKVKQTKVVSNSLEWFWKKI